MLVHSIMHLTPCLSQGIIIIMIVDFLSVHMLLKLKLMNLCMHTWLWLLHWIKHNSDQLAVGYIYVACKTYLLFGDLNIDITTNNSLYTQLCSIIITDQFSLACTVIPTGHTRVTDSSETILLILCSQPILLALIIAPLFLLWDQVTTSVYLRL